MTHGNDKGRSKASTIKFHPYYKNAAVASCEQGESFADFVHDALYNHVALKSPDNFKKFGLYELKMQYAEKHGEDPDFVCPRWASKLSKRTAKALIDHGYTGRVGVKKGVDSGFNFTSIPNLGPKQHAEIIEWAKS